MTGIVAITAPAIRCCCGISEEFKDMIPLDNVNILGSSKNMNAIKNSFQAIMNTYNPTLTIAGLDKGIAIFKII